MNGLAFITGASSGIGQALALRCYARGYALALSARRTDEIERWTQAAGFARERFTVYRADVAQIDEIAAAGNRCIEQQGEPDLVIANAGVSVAVDTARRADIDAVARTLATNVTGLAATFSRSSARCARVAAAGWSASPAWPASAACPAMRPTARARPP